MSPPQVATREEDDHIQGPPPRVPASPPPPFSSRPTSPSASDRLLDRQDPLDTPGGSDDEDDEADDRQRLVQSQPSAPEASSARSAPAVETRVAQYPAFATTTNQLYGSGRANDGVFANLSAKPSHSEEVDEKPPVCSSSSGKPLLTR
jgi:hypothetical protein